MSRQACVLVLALCLAIASICPETSWSQGMSTPVPKTPRNLGLKTEATFFENLSDNLYVVAQESEFTPGQYSIPRMFSGSIKLTF